MFLLLSIDWASTKGDKTGLCRTVYDPDSGFECTMLNQTMACKEGSDYAGIYSPRLRMELSSRCTPRHLVSICLETTTDLGIQLIILSSVDLQRRLRPSYHEQANTRLFPVTQSPAHLYDNVGAPGSLSSFRMQELTRLNIWLLVKTDHCCLTWALQCRFRAPIIA